ncbi:MAG: redoxin domain-containing protein [Candidatus Rokubacteria bacterium]|nr:redoxin domain-containing protein [Candidatus Rokubacteria bacterium]
MTESPMLRYGRPAPSFSLPSTSDRDVSLSDFRGKADVVLLFYCYDWGGI